MCQRELIIEENEYFGDFDLKKTLESGQTSQPPFKLVDNKYMEILSLTGGDILVSLEQEELNGDLSIKYSSDYDYDDEIRSRIEYIFDLDYDITRVYDFLECDEKLKDVYKFNKGLRLFKAQNPFECIISSICSANNSIKRWTKSVMDIREVCGACFESENYRYYQFPCEEKFLEMREDTLKNVGVGYRSPYMLNSTRMILEEDDYHDNIQKLSYEDAFDKIIELEGVGPKVADCILLYGYDKKEAYPVDVWINRITSYLYFKGRKTSNKRIMKFAGETFGEYSGYVQLYLFNYARLSGLTEKLKPKK